ncbi:hypothetical protein [Tenacibaculum ovolyticum]|uniref:hypothetical protein n=1 Tax=Tenacibaculum ovolyticum TaxID=104270 RepID=UPI0007ED56DF|nr:hypothetical protein [Tenacibaculum ovolyticum]
MLPERHPKIRVKDSTFDKIWLHYKAPDEIELTEKQQQVNERLLATWTSLVSGNTPTFTRNMLMQAYDIKQAQAYRYIRESQSLFGKVLKASIAGQKAMLFEMAKQNFNEAKTAKDAKTAAFYFKEMRELLGEEDEVLGFNPEKLENKPDKFIIPKEVSQVIVNHLEEGVIDFNKLTIEDISFDEIIEENEEEDE